jgi:hypothetical protein
MTGTVFTAGRIMKAIRKPSWLKTLLTIALLLLSSYLWRLVVIARISDTFPWGFPLQFYLAWGPCPPGEICNESNFFFVLLDLVFWYMISGFMLSRRTTERKAR